MSKVEVDQVDPQSGTTLTLGTSGDTVSIPSGVTLANAGTVTGIPTSALTGTIATAQIADDAVTLAKMAPGTDGNIISYDASGNPVAVATGSSGQVLTSAGAGAPPTFADAGGGAYEKLITTTISGNTSTVTFNSTYITSTYRDYRIIISDCHHTTGGGAYPEMQISDDNGSSFFTASNYRYAMRAYKSDATTNSQASNGTSEIRFSADAISGNESEEKSSFIIDMFDPLSTSSYFTMAITGMFYATGGNLVCGLYGGGSYRASVSSAINCVKLFMNTGDWNHGTFTLYGRKI